MQKENIDLAFYKSIFEKASDCILISNDKGQYIEVNQEACKCLGYSREEFLKLSVTDIVLDSQKYTVPRKSSTFNNQKTDTNQLWSSFLSQGKQSGLIDCYGKNGQIISFEYNAVSNIQPGVHLSILREINTISRIWDNIRNRDNRYENILKIFPDLLFLIDMEDRFTDYFTGDENKLYKSPEAFLGKNIQEVLPHPLSELILEKIREFKKTGKSVTFDYTISIDDQEYIYEGNIIRFREDEILFVARDITKLTQQNKELVATREKLNVLLNNIQQSVTLVDEHYNIIAFNRVAGDNARKIFSKGMKEGDSVLNFVVERDKKDFFKDFERALEGKEVYTERIFQDKTGNDAWYSFSYKKIPAHEMSQSAVILNVMDITRRKMAERIIIENENKYRSLFDTSPLGVGICDAKGNLLDVNDAFLKILGSKNKQETLSINVLEFYPLKSLGFSQSLKRCIENNQYISDSKAYKSFWGKEVFVKYQLSPLKHRRGKAQTIQIVLEDYTDLYKTETALRESESRYRNIFENAQIGIYQTTIGGKILKANDMQAQMLGFKNAHEYIHSVHNVRNLHVNPADRDKIIEMIKEKKVVNNFEYQSKTKDGKIIWISTTARLINIRNEKVIEGFNLDITERKQQVEIQKALEIKEKSAKIKDQFLANMSHEIRTPVTGIMGMSEILQKTKLDPDQQRYLNIIQESSSILLDLINDILDLAKIEAGKLDIFHEKFEIRDFMQKLFFLFEHRFRDKEIGLTLKTHDLVPQYVTTDPRRLKQILINLLSNALKFTQKGKVTINVDMKEQHDKTSLIKISITDTGTGISAENQKRIFEKFEQLNDSYVKKSTGTGLGLPITKELVKLLDGEIGLNSKPGKGSTFWFTFQSEDNHNTPLTIESNLEIVNERIRYDADILVVEDKKTNQMVVK
ncbi:MAG: PAS domain S-box protein, partial [Bacteroidota bacterium]